MGRSIVKQGRPCVLGAGTVSGATPLQVVSACYPPATQPNLRVASNARNQHEIGITGCFPSRNLVCAKKRTSDAAKDICQVIGPLRRDTIGTKRKHAA